VPTRRRHPKKEVEQAIRYAEQRSWVVEHTVAGHKWGRVSCRQGCTMSVWSTPRRPGDHAKDIRRLVDRCPHRDLQRSDPVDDQAEEGQGQP